MSESCRRKAEPGRLAPANGTKLYLGDQEIHGVTKIELVAEMNCVWTAVIHCHAVLDGEVVALVHGTEGEEVDLTTLADNSRVFAAARGPGRA